MACFTFFDSTGSQGMDGETSKQLNRMSWHAKSVASLELFADR